MFMLSQLFSSLALLTSMIFNVLYFLLVIRIVLSWFGMNPYNELTQILLRITDPILKPSRRLPLQIGGLDLSPIVAFLVLAFLRNFIVGMLTQLAHKFG